MDFANERYVRLYVRNTTTWRLLGWEGQCVLMQLLRVCDRAGVIDLDGVEPWEAVALHCGAPEDFARTGMAACLKRGSIVHDGDRLVFPRFLEAQECAASDAQRARESRAKRASLSRNVTPESQNVMSASQSVTDSHSASQPVTPSVPSVPSTPEELRSPPSARAHEEQSPFRLGHDLIREATGIQYGAEWRRELEQIGCKPESERRAVVDAIRGDPWCRANKTSVNPTHVLKHWAKYAAGNPPLKPVARAAVGGSKYAGPSAVAAPEDYVVKGEIKW